MNLANFAFLLHLRKRSHPQGALFLAYLVMYSSDRFAVTFSADYQALAVGLSRA